MAIFTHSGSTSFTSLMTSCIVYVMNACTSATATFVEVWRFGIDCWRMGTGWLTEVILDVAAHMPALRDGWSDRFRPSLMLVKAHAFVEGIAHRDLRRFTHGWRACPSI